jgi:glutathione peroxidase 6
MNGIKFVRPGNGFEPNFPLTQKIDVNGDKEPPLFAFLKQSCPSTRQNFASSEKLFYKPVKSRDIRWNFEKFLVFPKTGTVYKRYDASVNPLDMIKDIEFLLQHKNQRNGSQPNKWFKF